jgi:hypothetical protein
MTVNVRGLKELQRELHKLVKRAEAMDGEHQVPIDQLLTPGFIAAHTAYRDFASFLSASRFINGEVTPTAFAAIPEDLWDQWVAKNSVFPNWQEMLAKAGKEWAQHQLFGTEG